jgi:nanoRNase/pAp phosphatase (c-di-AMP/oligoRNAs hydrolase)
MVKKKFPNFQVVFEESVGDLKKFDGIIILDANELDQIIFLDKSFHDFDKIPYFFIDHHFKEEFKNEEHMNGIFFDDYASTAEIVVQILDEYNFHIPTPYRYLLVAGILSDSGYFKFANNKTFKTVAKLLNDKSDYQEILMMLKSKPDISKKIAQIKGAQRAELIKISDWLIGISEVSSFEASVANTLTKIGFDIAVVFSERTNEYRVSLRARKKVCLETGLHLGKILEEISKSYNASGGGHDGAASINILKEEGKLRDVILAKIRDVLNK